MADLFLDDFNGYTLGAAPPSPWVHTIPAGTTVTVEPDPAPGGGQGRVVRIFDGATGGFGFLTTERPLGISTLTRVVFDVKVRLVQTNEKLHFGWKGAGSLYGVALIFDTDGNVKVLINNSGGGTLTTLQAYSANVWYSVRYIVDTAFQGFRDVTINGVNYGDFAQAFFSPPEVTAFSVRTGGSNLGTFYIDDVRAAPGINTIQGIVRSSITGQPILGASVLVLRQSDNTIIATGSTNSAGLFAISVPSPDPTACVVLARKGATELGGGRAHVSVGA
jgi:hypothetical protein